MLSFLNQYAKNYRHSQNGEEGVILECWKRLNTLESDISAEIVPQDGCMALRESETGMAVEIGGNDGLYCSNAALLAEHGWDALFVEADYNLYLKSKNNWAGRDHVRHQCCRVDERNVNAFVTDECDLLSLDTDGGDYRIFCGLQARPKIVIVEIDSSLPPDKPGFNADGAAGYWSMTEAALERGYFVLVHCGNLVILRQEYAHLFPEVNKHPLLDYEHFFNDAWLKESAA